MSLVVFIGSLLGTMALGMPIAFALLASGLFLMLYLGNADSLILAQNLVMGADNFSLMAIPFFILAGELMNAGGISKRIIDFAISLLGHVRGGLGYVVIFTCVVFAGLSGSAVADTAAVAAIMVPMMAQAGYDRNRSTGLVAAGGIIAPVIPPSVAMIIYGVTGGVSITKLFMAGIIPGVMVGFGLVGMWWWISKKSNAKLRERQTLKQQLVAARKAGWALILPIVIIGGLRGGLFTPTESAVIAVFYAFFVGFVIYRELKIKDLYCVFLAAVKTTSVVMFLAAAAMVSGWLIELTNLPGILMEAMGPFVHNPLLLLIVINVLVIVVGTALDMTPTILILTPILLPVVVQAGIDPVYFGVLFVINNAIGLLTPPVGTVLNVAAGVAKITMDDIMKGVWPFLLVEVAVLFLLIFFPGIVLIPLKWFT